LRKLFYGWIIVGVTFMIGVTESGAFQNILAVFMKPMAQEVGWSRAVVTGSIAFGSLFAGLVSPIVGPILDRHGPRMVAFWGILILSAGLIGMRFVNHIWQFYLFFGDLLYCLHRQYISEIARRVCADFSELSLTAC